MTARHRRPDVSFVVPARNEEAYLEETLASVTALESPADVEVLVVDGDSSDDTPAIAREYGTTVLAGGDRGIGAARHLGAERADGDWLAFIDADTVVRRGYLATMLETVDAEGWAAGSSACRISGPRRAKLMEATINHLFPRLEYPILPGFNLFVHREAYWAVGGFPDVPNEDTAFSRELGRQFPTGYCPEVLVVTSGRRIAESGLTGTLWHYGRLDAGRLRAGY